MSGLVKAIEKLIKDGNVKELNTAILDIYRQAEKAAVKKGKKIEIDGQLVISLESIINELEFLLDAEMQSFDFINPTLAPDIVKRALQNWDPGKLTDIDQSRIGTAQSILLSMDMDAMLQQKQTEDYVEQQQINVREYKASLAKMIKLDLKNYDQSGGKTMEKEAKKIEATLKNQPLKLLAFKKYKAMTEAEDILRRNEPDVVESYTLHLKNNKSLLGQRRDPTFKTFAKKLGVVSAAIFGLGVGGYFAYHLFFGKKATEGKKIYQTAKNQSPTIKRKS